MRRQPIIQILWALPLVALCSCKGLPSASGILPSLRGAGVSPARNEMTASPAVEPAKRLPHAKVPYPVQQAAYYPGTLPPSAWTGQPHDHAPGHSCPHCGGGKLPVSRRLASEVLKRLSRQVDGAP